MLKGHSPRTRARAFFLVRVAQGLARLECLCCSISVRVLKKVFRSARMPCSAHYLNHHSRHLHRARRLPLHHRSLQIRLLLHPRCLADLLNNLLSTGYEPNAQRTPFVFYHREGAVWNFLVKTSLPFSKRRRRVKDWTWDGCPHHFFRRSERQVLTPFGIYHSNGESSEASFSHLRTSIEKSIARSQNKRRSSRDLGCA